MAQVADTRGQGSGTMADFPRATVKVGDWISFKSDIEQSGQITKIEGNRLHLYNEHGFRGDYLRYAKTTIEDARDCWI